MTPAMMPAMATHWSACSSTHATGPKPSRDSQVNSAINARTDQARMPVKEWAARPRTIITGLVSLTGPSWASRCHSHDNEFHVVEELSPRRA